MKQWYIARADKRFGPFTREEMILLRQDCKIFESDMVWKQGLRQWKPMILTEEFSLQSIAELARQKDTHDLFNRRQWPRAKVNIPVIIHNNTRLWSARTTSLSCGGALISIDTPSLEPGTKLHLNFTDQRSSGKRFSCEGVVTAKRFNSERLRFNSTFQYSIQFKTKDPCADEILSRWVKQNGAY